MRVAHDYSTRGDDASRNRLLLPKVLRTAKWPYHEETTRFHLSIAFLIWDVGKIAWKKLQWINLTFLGILKFTNHTRTSHLRVVKQRIKEHAHLSVGVGVIIEELRRYSKQIFHISQKCSFDVNSHKNVSYFLWLLAIQTFSRSDLFEVEMGSLLLSIRSEIYFFGDHFLCYHNWNQHTSCSGFTKRLNDNPSKYNFWDDSQFV